MFCMYCVFNINYKKNRSGNAVKNLMNIGKIIL